MEVPAEAQRTERGVFVVVAEFRRAFVTEREIDEIAVVPDVVGVDVESEHTRTVFAAARAAFGVSRGHRGVFEFVRKDAQRRERVAF